MELALKRMEERVLNDLDKYAFSEKINKEKAAGLRTVLRREEIEDFVHLRSELLYYLDDAKTLFPYVYEEE